MNIELTALIESQAKTLIVMACAGVLTGVLWESKSIIQKKISILLDEEQRYFRTIAIKYITSSNDEDGVAKVLEKL